MKILAIESSCDDTAVAITEGREILASVIHSQVDEHTLYGGVVPESHPADILKTSALYMKRRWLMQALQSTTLMR